MRITMAFAIAFSAISLVGLDGVAIAKERPDDNSGMKSELTEEQREAMQTQVFESDPDTVYAALISVVQAEAWTIDNADKELGLLQATSLKSRGGVSPAKDWILKIENKQERMRTLKKYERRNLRTLAWTRWSELTATIESGKNGTTRVRVIIIKAGNLPTMNRSKRNPLVGTYIGSRAGSEESVILEDASVYQKFFQKVRSQVSAREEG